MKNNRIILNIFFVQFFIITGFIFKAKGQNEIVNGLCNAKWSGTVTEHSQFTGLPGILGSEHQISVTFTDNIGSGSYRETGEMWAEGKLYGKIVCNGSGPARFSEITFHKTKGTYTIQIVGLMYTCTHSGPGGTDTDTDPSEAVITVDDEPWNNNLKELSGSKILVTESPTGGKLTTTITWNLKRECPPWNDSYTEKRIKTLNKKVIGPASRFIKRVNDELCIQLRVAHGLRSKKEQDELYAQGRTKPGKIVTNAKGGESNHESGLAIDVYVTNCDGKVDLSNKVPPQVVKIAKEEGFEWGGDWTKKNKQGKVFKDYPHFEMK